MKFIYFYVLQCCLGRNSANPGLEPIFSHSRHYMNTNDVFLIENATDFAIFELANKTDFFDSLYSTSFSFEGEPVQKRVIVFAKFFDKYPIEKWKSLGYLDDNFFDEINPHWFNFPPPSERSHYVFAGIYLLLAAIGLSGNALVIFMILSFRSLRTPSNILVVNLALSDFLMMAKTPIFVYNSLHCGPILGEIGCQLYAFMGGLTGTASIMTLAAVALDRYYVIAYPLDPAHKMTKIKAVAWVFFIWTYACSFSIVPLLKIAGVSSYVPEGYLTSCSFNYLSETKETRIFIFTFFVAAWCVPFSIITFSYVGICRAAFLVGLKRQGQEKEKRKRELKLALVVILVIALWFVSWTPYAIVALLGIFGRKDLISPLVSMIPAIFCKSAACTNPFLYSLNHPRLRQEILKVLCPQRFATERTWRSTWKTNSFVAYRNSVRDSCHNIKENSAIKRNSASIELENINVIDDFSSV